MWDHGIWSFLYGGSEVPLLFFFFIATFIATFFVTHNCHVQKASDVGSTKREKKEHASHCAGVCFIVICFRNNGSSYSPVFAKLYDF